jgi:hypothetical protein
MDRNDPTHVETEQEREERERANRDKREGSTAARVTPDQNPPRTTKNGFTAPKFGSAGSGGAEFEPGPERD